jgi:DNA-binding IscR family transcriptional regulator
MAYPRDEGGYILDTDACDVSIGTVLSQIQDGQEKVIAFHVKCSVGALLARTTLEIFKGIYIGTQTFFRRGTS